MDGSVFVSRPAHTLIARINNSILIHTRITTYIKSYCCTKISPLRSNLFARYIDYINYMPIPRWGGEGDEPDFIYGRKLGKQWKGRSDKAVVDSDEKTCPQRKTINETGRRRRGKISGQTHNPPPLPLPILALHEENRDLNTRWPLREAMGDYIERVRGNIQRRKRKEKSHEKITLLILRVRWKL